VGISTEISESLKQEGLVRDLIRQVQNLRKDSGLKVEDRIEIEINGSKELNNAVVSYESYFMNEVLGVKLDMGDCITFKYNDSVKIAGEKTIIGISPLI
jgi:isoleucyl-tRNA synthetase